MTFKQFFKKHNIKLSKTHTGKYIQDGIVYRDDSLINFPHTRRFIIYNDIVIAYKPKYFFLNLKVPKAGVKFFSHLMSIANLQSCELYSLVSEHKKS